MKTFIDFPKVDLPKGDVVATLRWKGDGYVGEIVKDGAQAPPEEWISCKKAAEILGFEGKHAARTVLRLADDGFLTQKRPSPKKVKILLASVLAHNEKAKDPDFWIGKKLRQWRGKPEPKPAPAKPSGSGKTGLQKPCKRTSKGRKSPGHRTRRTG